MRCHHAAARHASEAKYCPRRARARAAPRSTSSSTQRTRPGPVRCNPAATRHARRTPHCPRQGKCSNCIAQYTHFKPRWRRISTRQLTEALPKARQGFLLRLAAHQLQCSAPVRCNATPPQLILPAEPSTAQGKASAHAAPRSTPTSSHASVESLDASCYRPRGARQPCRKGEGTRIWCLHAGLLRNR